MKMEKTSYEAPELRTMEVKVETGIAQSLGVPGGGGAIMPDPEDEFEL